MVTAQLTLVYPSYYSPMRFYQNIKNIPLKSALIVALFFITIGVVIQSCTYHNKQTILGSTGTCDTINTKYGEVISVIMTDYCTSCHGGSSPSAGISLETYDDVKNNYTAILYTMNKGTMPKGGKLDDCTISKIQTWVNRGAQNN